MSGSIISFISGCLVEMKDVFSLLIINPAGKERRHRGCMTTTRKVKFLTWFCDICEAAERIQLNIRSIKGFFPILGYYRNVPAYWTDRLIQQHSGAYLQVIVHLGKNLLIFYFYSAINSIKAPYHSFKNDCEIKWFQNCVWLIICLDELSNPCLFLQISVYKLSIDSFFINRGILCFTAVEVIFNLPIGQKYTFTGNT